MKIFSQYRIFLFNKLNYRTKCSRFMILLCSIFIILLNLLSNVNCKCNEVTCMNGGLCKNSTCICADGWQGSECQFCGGKVR